MTSGQDGLTIAGPVRRKIDKAAFGLVFEIVSHPGERNTEASLMVVALRQLEHVSTVGPNYVGSMGCDGPPRPGTRTNSGFTEAKEV